VKNLSAAIEIATAARESLTIAGGHRPWLLRAGAMLRGHRWVGPVAGERKAELLAGASSLLFPVRWPEPFGLVMVESMLSGTPVVGSRIGSVPEVVGEAGGVTVDAPFWESTDRAERVARLGSWIEALGRAEKMDRGAVREEALRRFSNRRMAEDYLNVYKQVIRGERL
jgi:glycosyltransferase involved in cell wall biosynthesis